MVTGYIAGVKHDANLRTPPDEEPLDVAFARARASYAAGTGVEHRIVPMWLRTWGKADCRPFGEWLAAWNG